MSRTVEGVAAILHTPMTRKPVIFGDPGPFPLYANAPVMYCGQDVGEVTTLRVEDDRLLWTGRLHPPTLSAPDPVSPLAIPVPADRPHVELVEWLIAAERLVGIPAVVEASTRHDGAFTVMSGWTVLRIDLLPAKGRPWPQLELHLR